MSKTVWSTTYLEAAARDLVDVGIWEIAGQEVQEKTAQESAEAQQRAARASLTQAQAEYTRAICVFMETKNRWKAAAAPLPDAAPHPVPPTSSLEAREAAETDLRRARCLYSLVLEQSQRMQHLLQHTRAAFHHARERFENLAALSESAANNEGKIKK